MLLITSGQEELSFSSSCCEKASLLSYLWALVSCCLNVGLLKPPGVKFICCTPSWLEGEMSWNPCLSADCREHWETSSEDVRHTQCTSLKLCLFLPFRKFNNTFSRWRVETVHMQRASITCCLSLSFRCLNACTYCKTKHARGDLASYPIKELVERARQSFLGESISVSPADLMRKEEH